MDYTFSNCKDSSFFPSQETIGLIKVMIGNEESSEEIGVPLESEPHLSVVELIALRPNQIKFYDLRGL
jgi:hypothetical protein